MCEIINLQVYWPWENSYLVLGSPERQMSKFIQIRPVAALSLSAFKMYLPNDCLEIGFHS